MKLYNFKRLINKYSVKFCLHRIQGGYVGGKWELGGELVKEMRGAIVPIGEKRVYSSGGTYTSQDRELYTTERLKDALCDLRVVHNGNTYTVEGVKDFGDYADVYVYTLKWVSMEDVEHD